MREIKFRVYDHVVDDGCDAPMGICPVDSLFWYEGEQYVTWLYGTSEGKVSEYQVMQYTGLTDKNGREIFEGDIVAWQHYDAEYQTQRASPVTFESACYYTKWKGSKYRLCGWKDGVLEVIGNIYENPELLEQSS